MSIRHTIFISLLHAFLQILPVEIATEKSPDQELANSPEPKDDIISEGDENRGGSPESNGDTAENDEDNKATDDKAAPMSPTSPTTFQAFWRPKQGLNKRPPGFQGQLCCSCQTTGNTMPLCYLTMSSAFGM